LNESNKLLDELIEKGNVFWLKDDYDFSYDIGKDEFKEFLSKSYVLVKNTELTLSQLLGRIEYQIEKTFYDYYESSQQVDEIYWILHSFITDVLKEKHEILELYSYIKNSTFDEIWTKAKFALEIIVHFGEYLEDTKEASSLSGLLFSNWDDLEDWLQRGDNTAEENIAYQELLCERREIVLKAIFVLDKNIMKKPMERAITETYIGWGTNWDQLLALKFLFLLNKKERVKDYLESIIAALNSCRYDDYESNKDCIVAMDHLYNFDTKLAIDTLFLIMKEGELSPADDWKYYRTPVEYIVGETEEMKDYFRENLKQLKNPPVEEIYIRIIEKDEFL